MRIASIAYSATPCRFCLARCSSPAPRRTRKRATETVVCRLNGKLYLRRLDQRGGRTILEATNPRYSAIRFDRKNDRFLLVAVVCTIDA
jgi:hypothetical protein